MSDKHVYRFNEGNKTMRELLGGKGANLAEMTTIGLPVPPGFTITTEVCNYYSTHGDYPAGVDDAEGLVGGESCATTPTRFFSACAPARAPPCPA